LALLGGQKINQSLPRQLKSLPVAHRWVSRKAHQINVRLEQVPCQSCRGAVDPPGNQCASSTTCSGQTGDFGWDLPKIGLVVVAPFTCDHD
jgi:hypothetical protein